MNDKYTDGQEAQEKLLELEGYNIISGGKKYQLADVAVHLFRLK